MRDLAIPSTCCSDCGVDRTTLSEGKLRRGRCGTCYQRFLRESKAAGTFEPIQAASPWPLRRVFEKAIAGPFGCAIWTGERAGSGYGVLYVAGRRTMVHRVAYEAMVGPIPDGMLIDHACHNRDLSCLGGWQCLHRRCLNPFHLEPVTSQENTLRSHLTLAGKNARKTHCYQGHEFTPENTRFLASGRRACRVCGLDLQRKYAARDKAAGIKRKR